MLLAIDIGNTDTKLGVFEGDELRVTWHVATVLRSMADEYATTLLSLLHYHGLDRSDIKDVALCSVVPPLIATFHELFERYFGVSPLVIGVGVKTGVHIRMDNPKEVGADRIVNAAAAHHLYDGPVIIADLGSATTFDAVSREGDYLGGAIAPGMNMAAEALSTRTAMLPRVELIPPKQAIGTSTVAAMQSGLIFGYVGLVEGIVTRIKNELGGKATVVATGGYAEIFARQTKIIDVVNPDLTLIGLKIIQSMNKS
jgi:type III pantothenate kinase